MLLIVVYSTYICMYYIYMHIILMRIPFLETNPIFYLSTVVTFPLQRLRSPSRCPTWTSWATLRIACTARMAWNPRRRERRGHGSRCGGTWGVSKMVGFNRTSCGIHRENWWTFGILWDFIGFGAISSKVVGRRITPYLSLIQWLVVQTWIFAGWKWTTCQEYGTYEQWRSLWYWWSWWYGRLYPDKRGYHQWKTYRV